MQIRHANFFLRSGGTILLVASYFAVRGLYQLVHSGGRHQATPLECLVAAVGFVAASIGSALLIIGPHLFDKMVVADRWRRHDIKVHQ